jgi:hypothetical protein
MLKLPAICLVALLIGGALGRRLVAAEPSAHTPPLKYEEPTLLTGTIYPKDSGQKTVLYRFRRTAMRTSSKLTVLREFIYPDGKIAARERATYDGNDLVSYSLDESQIGAAGSAAIRREAGNPAKGIITFEYHKDVAEGGKPKTSTEALRPDTLVSDLVGPFLAEHWAELAQGEKVKCRYVVVPRRETVGFTFLRDSEASYKGSKAVIIRMEATSPIIARLVDPLYFTVEKEAPHRIFQFVGRMTPKVKLDGAWKDLDAVMLFDWPER